MRPQQRIGAVPLVIAAGFLGVGWDGVIAAVAFPAVALVCYGAVVLGARYRWPVWLVGPGLVAATAGGGAVLAAAHTGTDLVTTGRDLVPRLLSLPYPAPATVDTIAPGAVLVAAVAVGCAIRVSRPGGGVLAPLVSVATLYLTAVMVSGGRADPHGLVAGVLLAATVADWLLDEVVRPAGAEAPERPQGWASASASLRLAAARSLPVLALVAGTVLIASSVPVAAAFEPRRIVERPAQVLAQANPLALLAAWTRDGGTELIRLRAESPTMLRLVALDQFTGEAWSASGGFTPLGTEVLDLRDAALPAGERLATVDVEVTLTAALDGHWLPMPGRPEATSLSGVLVQPVSGAVARLETSSAGLRYRIRAQIDAPAPAALSRATVPGGPQVHRYLDTPRLPATLAELARTTVRGAGTPYERAERIEEAVRGRRTLDPAAPAGSSYARLAEFLTPGAAGTAEQFASAFAVLARAAGLPTRIVVGFRPADRDEQGQWLIRGRDAVAWPEVYFTGAGWVPFDPRPRGTVGILRPA